MARGDARSLCELVLISIVYIKVICTTDYLFAIVLSFSVTDDYTAFRNPLFMSEHVVTTVLPLHSYISPQNGSKKTE